MIARIIYFRSRIWFALISRSGMTLDKFLLPPSSGGSLVSVIAFC